MTEWIKCSDRMPQDGVTVWVWDGESVMTGRHNVDTVEWVCELTDNYQRNYYSGKRYKLVTHWMPLDIPEPLEPELLPCPFCGSDRIKLYKSHDGNWGVLCDRCDTTIKYYGFKSDIIEAWNRRDWHGKEED